MITLTVSKDTICLFDWKKEKLFRASLSSLLCGHGNALPSKKPKYTLKSSSDYPYQLTYLLSKHIPETDVNQAWNSGNSEHTNTRARKICFYFDEKRLWMNPYRSYQGMDEDNFLDKDLM